LLLPLPRPQKVRECIYCGASNVVLGTEHIIPYALNGDYTIPEASCTACEKVTSRFERDTLRCLYFDARNVLRMRSRHSRPRLEYLKIYTEFDFDGPTKDVKLEEYPLYLPIPKLRPPGAICGRPPDPGYPVEIEFRHIAGPSTEDYAKSNAYATVASRLNYSPTDFSRSIAKIGFCAAVKSLGIEPLRGLPIISAILGQDFKLGYWVGSSTFQHEYSLSGLHTILVRCSGRDIHVFIRLFSQFTDHEYHVFVGSVNPVYTHSEQWPFKEP